MHKDFYYQFSWMRISQSTKNSNQIVQCHILKIRCMNKKFKYKECPIHRLERHLRMYCRKHIYVFDVAMLHFKTIYQTIDCYVVFYDASFLLFPQYICVNCYLHVTSVSLGKLLKI